MIDPDEPILRRVANCPGFYDRQKAPPVGRGAFTPNSSDTDGLSFYLERFISPSELVAATKKPLEKYLVVRFLARELYALGLTLYPDQQPDDSPGHLLVREITYPIYKDPVRKKKLKEIILQLAQLASERIVLGHSIPPP